MALNGILGPDGKQNCVLFEDRRPPLAVMERLRQRLAVVSGPTCAEAPSDVAMELSRAFAVMPAHGANPALRAQVYLEELGDLPAWAIALIVRKYVRGELGNSKFAPTIAEIREHVAKIAAPVKRERDRIEKVLDFWSKPDGRPNLKIVK